MEENVIELEDKGERNPEGSVFQEDPGSTFPDKHTLPGGVPPFPCSLGRQCLPGLLVPQSLP